MTNDIDLSHLVEVVFVSIRHYKVTPTHSLCSLWEEATMCSLCFEWDLWITLMVERVHKLLEILLHARFVASHPFIYSIINLYQ